MNIIMNIVMNIIRISYVAPTQKVYPLDKSYKIIIKNKIINATNNKTKI